MKSLIKILTFLILFFTNNIYSQDLEGRDVWVSNLSTNNRTISVRVYPVSMVFNKPDVPGHYLGNYDLHSQYPIEGVFNYINGRGIASDFFTITPPNEMVTIYLLGQILFFS